ncbi:MAG: Crp/Fnr family transcriptional regulator [Bacteroidia bacterium]
MSKKISCSDCTNFVCYIRQHCSFEWLNRIGLKKIQIEHQPKDIIFREGGYVEGTYFIQQGNVKIVASGIDHREQIVRMVTSGQVLGHRGMDDDKYPVSAIALSETAVCFIDNETLYEAYMQNPKLTFQMVEFYSHELQKAEIRMKYLAQMNVREKIAEALLFIKDVFGLNKSDDTLNVSLSRQEIADMTGVMVEQVSRELGQFVKKKFIIKKGRSGIKLSDINGLQDVIRKYGIEQYT